MPRRGKTVIGRHEGALKRHDFCGRRCHLAAKEWLKGCAAEDERRRKEWWQECHREEAARVDALQRLSYDEYLVSEHWIRKRSEAKSRAGYKCQLCGLFGGKYLNVHHASYDRLGHESATDLIVLCRACHAKFHDKLPAHPDGGRSNAQEQA
jgi:hypothetical protein